MARELTAGPEDGPPFPFPIRLSGKVIKGFGRGSKELGIPTANLPITGLDVGGHSDIDSGVYFGWAALNLSTAFPSSSKVSDPIAPKDSISEHPATSADRILDAPSPVDAVIYPMVMSIGWNPVYKNEVRSVEVHVMHKFEHDFYNAMMNVSILGFIRHERDYDGLDGLIADINTDILVAKRSLERPAYARLSKDSFLNDFSWASIG